MRTTLLLFLCLFSFLGTHAQAYGPDGWTMIGGTNIGVPPYSLLHYKLVEVKNNGDRYANIINVSVQGDANYPQMQATYQLRIEKYEGTADRFDGVEIRTISGNPSAAVFFVFNNAVWVRPNYQWGAVFVRSEGFFGGYSPLTGGTWGQTVTEPPGYLAITGSHGLRCDFDNNNVFKLPHTDAFGSFFVNERVGIGTTILGDYKLAVEGTIGARKVKVTQAAWADFVFHPSYKPLPIDSVETYIEKHQHLPGIPSEKEVTENGLDLGDMHKKLLQQVEEQMLYIISLKKEMKEMQEVIATLKKSK